jgi:hypothetical protein
MLRSREQVRRRGLRGGLERGGNSPKESCPSARWTLTRGAVPSSEVETRPRVVPSSKAEIYPRVAMPSSGVGVLQHGA